MGHMHLIGCCLFVAHANSCIDLCNADGASVTALHVLQWSARVRKQTCPLLYIKHQSTWIPVDCSILTRHKWPHKPIFELELSILFALWTTLLSELLFEIQMRVHYQDYIP